MKILFIHNFYRTTSPSGEDAVATNERTSLLENGFNIVSYEKFNDDIKHVTLSDKIKTSLNNIWSINSYNDIIDLIIKESPNIAHIHSIHPQISPSIYAACQKMGVPTVHTLHNYRYICPGALLQRNGRPCEDCIGHLPFNSLRHKCYRNSLTATGAIFCMIMYNRFLGTFTNRVDRYIALTNFAASRLASGGIPVDRIEVKPNFLPEVPIISKARQRYAVYVGRLSAEKGVRTLLKAWRLVFGFPLKIIGDGPLRDELELCARKFDLNVQFLGHKSKKDVLSIIGNSYLQVIPSECYEGFPMVVLEAFATATPVVASRIGSLAEIIHDSQTGFHFEAANFVDLADKVNKLKINEDKAYNMGAKAREIFLNKYTSKQNIKQLTEIYHRAQLNFAKKKRG